MLLLISSLLVIIYTILCVAKVSKHKSKLNNMVGMTVVMVFAMISSILVGLIAGIIYRGDLTLSTIVAVCFSMVVAVLIGRLISQLALLEGVVTGIMGGMMGAMLGEMLPPVNYQLMLVFTDVLFIAITVYLIVLINSEVKKAGEDSVPFNPRTSQWVITSVIAAILILTFAQLEQKPVLGQTINMEENNQTHDHNAHKH